MPNGWEPFRQRLGYKTILEVIGFKDVIPPESSVLDVGCGTGEFAEYCAGQYEGIDIRPDIVRMARQNYPGMKFTCGDILTYKPGKKYDYVIASGMLSVHIPESADDPYLESMLWKMNSLAGRGVAFNFLTKSFAHQTDPDIICYEPDTVMALCQRIFPGATMNVIDMPFQNQITIGITKV
jgi:SAM-dependent methyltransferase